MEIGCCCSNWNFLCWYEPYSSSLELADELDDDEDDDDDDDDEVINKEDGVDAELFEQTDEEVDEFV